jgi:hypothetical protein
MGKKGMQCSQGQEGDAVLSCSQGQGGMQCSQGQEGMHCSQGSESTFAQLSPLCLTFLLQLLLFIKRGILKSHTVPKYRCLLHLCTVFVWLVSACKREFMSVYRFSSLTMRAPVLPGRAGPMSGPPVAGTIEETGYF